jgi:hypothetical protein
LARRESTGKPSAQGRSMVTDLSKHHEPVGSLLDESRGRDWREYRLSDEQVAFFHENGYLAGLRVLDDQQIDALRTELAELVNPAHPGSTLFYEYNSNESNDPPANCSQARSASGTTSCSASPRITAAWSPGTRTIPIGRAPGRCRT